MARAPARWGAAARTRPGSGFPTAHQPKKNPLRAKPRHWEHELQVSLFGWWTINVSPLDGLAVAIPNGGDRPELEAARLVGEGVWKGAADLVLILPGARVHWVEVKLEKNVWHDKTYQSPEQRDFEKRVLAMGHRYTVVRSIEEFAAVLAAEGVPMRSVPYGPSRALRG